MPDSAAPPLGEPTPLPPAIATARVVKFGGMVWPRHDTEIGWTLRYGAPSRADLLVAASVLNAYHALVDATAEDREMVVRELRATLPSEGARP